MFQCNFSRDTKYQEKIVIDNKMDNSHGLLIVSLARRSFSSSVSSSSSSANPPPLISDNVRVRDTEKMKKTEEQVKQQTSNRESRGRGTR